MAYILIWVHGIRKEAGKKLYMDFKGAGGEFFEKMNLLPI